MDEDIKVVGLVAGGGQFPLMIAEAAKEKGLRVVAVAHHGETDPSLSETRVAARLAPNCRIMFAISSPEAYAW